MALQVERAEVTEHHRASCTERLNTILQQWGQLKLCFDQLIDDVLQQKRTFRVYHQFKMYNDPTLNPELYALEQKDL